MRISDWSSDVCSSDLRQGATPCPFPQERLQPRALRPLSTIKIPRLEPLLQRISLHRAREVPRLQRLACAAWRGRDHRVFRDRRLALQVTHEPLTRRVNVMQRGHVARGLVAEAEEEDEKQG